MSVASENSVHFLISIGRSRSFSFQARTRSSCVVRQLTTADSHHLRDPARVVAIAFVDLRLEKRLRVSRFDADRRDSCFRQSTEQPLRQRPSLETDTFEPPCGIAKNSEKVLGVTYHLHFTANPARLVDDAYGRFFDRHVQSGIVFSCCVPPMMLVAAQHRPRLPEAQHPSAPRRASRPAEYPI